MDHSSVVGNPGTDPSGLTHRQMEILRSRAWGLPNKAIAFQLGINEHTVKTHATLAYQALGVTCLIDALRALGWLRVPAR